jgi:hypothetical protein
MKNSAGVSVLALAGLVVCMACGGGSMAASPPHSSATASTSTNPLTATFSAHGGYSCAPITNTDYCPGQEFAKLATVPAHGHLTITRITFQYTVGRPMLNAENPPPGPPHQVALPCTNAPTINLGSPENPIYSLNLKSGGDANYPANSNPALNDSGPLAIQLTAPTEVSYGFGNPLDTINPPNYGCWYGETDGSVQGKLAVQYTTP